MQRIRFGVGCCIEGEEISVTSEVSDSQRASSLSLLDLPDYVLIKRPITQNDEKIRQNRWKTLGHLTVYCGNCANREESQ